MHPIIKLIIYLLFLLSGASALMYQIIWTRSLSLIFGGSHLAITTTLSVFMLGLSLGGYFGGRYIRRFRNLLQLYGFLEFGIALFAIVFMALIKLYPAIYVFLARYAIDSPVYLTSIRVLFSGAALLVPTFLMGATLPVLSSLVASQPKELGKPLSFLYGMNTLGGVIGAVVTGFYLMRAYSINTSLAVAFAVNVLVGCVSIVLQGSFVSMIPAVQRIPRNAGAGYIKRPDGAKRTETIVPYYLILTGVGVSGFCALGYEVLWTRILIFIIGTTAYGFTLILASFLSGIGLGGASYGVFHKILGATGRRPESSTRSIVGFGLVQIIIGLTSLFILMRIFSLPGYSVSLQKHLQSWGLGGFATTQLSNFVLAFTFLFVPSFFMGLAFPLAGKIHAAYKNAVGSAVGDILAVNTIGAILGAAVSGYVLIYLLGIETSIHILILVNVGFGLLVMSSLSRRKSIMWAVAGCALAFTIFLAVNPGSFRALDMRFFAVYRNYRPELFKTQDLTNRMLDLFDVVYNEEGAESIVSVTVNRENGMTTFSINGRVEASSAFSDAQNQYLLGHIPMLLSKNPKKVLVVGGGAA